MGHAAAQVVERNADAPPIRGVGGDHEDIGGFGVRDDDDERFVRPEGGLNRRQRCGAAAEPAIAWRDALKFGIRPPGSGLQPLSGSEGPDRRRAPTRRPRRISPRRDRRAGDPAARPPARPPPSPVSSRRRGVPRPRPPSRHRRRRTCGAGPPRTPRPGRRRRGDGDVAVPHRAFNSSSAASALNPSMRGERPPRSMAAPVSSSQAGRAVRALSTWVKAPSLSPRSSMVSAMRRCGGARP